MVRRAADSAHPRKYLRLVAYNSSGFLHAPMIQCPLHDHVGFVRGNKSVFSTQPPIPGKAAGPMMELRRRTQGPAALATPYIMINRPICCICHSFSQIVSGDLPIMPSEQKYPRFWFSFWVSGGNTLPGRKLGVH